MRGPLSAPVQREYSPDSSPGRSEVIPPSPQEPSIGFTLVLCLLTFLTTVLLVRTLGSRLPDPRAAQPAPIVRTAVTSTGELIKSLRVGGTIEALRYATVRAPRLSGLRDSGRTVLTFVKLSAAGSQVEADSVVAEFEFKWLADHIEDVLSNVALWESNLQRRRAQILILKENERQRRLNAWASFQKTLLDLRTAEVRSAIEVQILKSVSELAQVTWRQLEEEGRLMESVLPPTCGALN